MTNNINTHSFSGADIRPYILYSGYSASKESTSIVSTFGGIEQLSISQHTDIIQVRQMGSSVPSTILTGNSTVAGSIVMVVQDEHPLMPLARSYKSFLIQKEADLNSVASPKGFSKNYLGGRYSMGGLTTPKSKLEASGYFEMPSPSSLPPFDLVLVFTNENYRDDSWKSAHKKNPSPIINHINRKKEQEVSIQTLSVDPGMYYYTVAIIRNIKIPDVAINLSIDDIMTEVVFQFVATEFIGPFRVQAMSADHEANKAYEAMSDSPYLFSTFGNSIETVMSYHDLQINR